MKNWPILLGVAAFVAVMLASAGAALVPSSMRLTGPVLCPAGTLNVDLHRFSDPLHGSGYTIDVSCTERGQRRDVSEFLVFLVLSGIYLIPCFLGLQALRVVSRVYGQWRAGNRPAPLPVSADLDPEQELHAALAEGDIIRAVKLVRQRTDMGLKEARDYVVAMASGAPPPDEFTAPSRPDEFAAPSDDSFETLQQLKSMLDAGLITAREYEEKKREILSRM